MASLYKQTKGAFPDIDFRIFMKKDRASAAVRLFCMVIEGF
jgi:hypothetical protein